MRTSRRDATKLTALVFVVAVVMVLATRCASSVTEPEVMPTTTPEPMVVTSTSESTPNPMSEPTPLSEDTVIISEETVGLSVSEAMALGYQREEEPCLNRDTFPSMYEGVAYEELGDGMCAFYYPTSTPALEPTPLIEGTVIIGVEPTPTMTPIPTPYTLTPGTYQVGVDIEPGIYAGRTGTGIFDSCYWERLSGVSGEFDDLIANDNAIGQFYIEIQPTDRYFTVRCEITRLKDWPAPAQLLSEIGPGMYIVGRDIAPGTYQGSAGTDILESCYWARLGGLSDELGDIIANDNANGSFYVEVAASDMVFETACDMKLIE